MAADALGAHARDELGLTEGAAARPLQAAAASALSFGIGAALPLAVVLLVPEPRLVAWVAATSLVFLAGLGALAAGGGGAGVARGAARVTLWGAAAMGVTAAVGALFGAAVA
jgi:VIT1/CCC1 family predicted Fe2+/Mn2+ transporter